MPSLYPESLTPFNHRLHALRGQYSRGGLVNLGRALFPATASIVRFLRPGYPVPTKEELFLWN